MNRPKRKSATEMVLEVENFNLKHKVGDRVNVRTDSGETVEDVIQYPATIMGGHTPMAWLKKSGSYVLDRVSTPH